MITFDAEKHEYRDKSGIVLPSVTQILSAVGLVSFDKVPGHVLDLAAERGHIVHYATELLDKGVLDESSIDPALVGYIDGYRKFLRDYRIAKFEAIERIISNSLGFAGTLDRLAVMSTGLRLLYDIKSGVKEPLAHQLQLTAYNISLPKKEQADELGCVYLDAGGTYQFEPYKEDRYGWLTVFNWYKWKTNKRIA